MVVSVVATMRAGALCNVDFLEDTEGTMLGCVLIHDASLPSGLEGFLCPVVLDDVLRVVGIPFLAVTGKEHLVWVFWIDVLFFVYHLESPLVSVTMRTPDEVAEIKRHITAPYSIANFLNLSEVTHLVRMFSTGSKLVKNTGPVTVDMDRSDSVARSILGRLVPHIGTFEVTAAFLFKTDTPHIIHNDDTYELPPTIGKAITIPLQLEGYVGGNLPKLCFFEQFYFHGPAKFFGGDSDVPTYYNQQVYEYSKVDGLVDTPFIDRELVPHLKASWLKGLSLHSALDWKPTSALVFDSVRLHCASDFRLLGVRSKLALSVFTKRQ